jgi:hypothetical protein
LKEIFTEYGELVIAVFAACLLIPLFGSIRLPSGLEAKKLYTDAFHEYASEGKVAIEYLNVPVSEQIRALVDEHFLASANASEQAVQVHIAVALDDEGNRIHSEILEGKEGILFGKAGIYTVYVQTVDAIGRTQYGKLKFPVQRKRI